MSNKQPGWAIVIHGGVGEPMDCQDGCERAAERALERLREGGEALDAAVSAIVVLEDDGRFNAGTGAALGLDGATIEMDASVMDTRGRLGAVACVRDVKNPVLLARSVAETPHCLLAGEGADRLARALGLSPHPGPSDRQREEHRKMLHELIGSMPAMPGVDNGQFAQFWNYNVPLQLPKRAKCDTVGAVVRDADGNFAVAASTGGSAPSLLGRVGDTPIVGAGFYAGPEGAVAATGIGEQIMRHLLARTVYQWIADGMPLQQALQRGVDLIDKRYEVGLIAVSRQEAGHATNQSEDMPHARIIGR
ncbi:isoaspartyl peptidase/L-asparaginase [Massilia agilis]|uniref:Isoaspartyl peptidase/L-asparaginase n=1 Tax=Massilia agilis TaxID=1811226 RepID=A0ABT2D8V0_9BURK|nr:isoaspartyl peptidase/L-asparaginase [Massilia agilis]MCS0807747.1 isoaspartyl peptidase/L-asparaginase [Massilia agilis]